MSERACAACGKRVLGSGESVVCAGNQHLHHRRCADRIGVCAVQGCGGIVFQAPGATPLRAAPPSCRDGEEKPSRALVKVPQIPPDQAVFVPARWDGGTVYCPHCHGVNPWPADACVFCDAPLCDEAQRNPQWLAKCLHRDPPTPVRAVAFGARFLALLHLAVVGWIFAVCVIVWWTGGPDGAPDIWGLLQYYVRHILYCTTMAFGFAFVGKRLEAGSQAARVMLFAACGWFMLLDVPGMLMAAVLFAPMMLPGSRRHFARIAAMRQLEA